MSTTNVLMAAAGAAGGKLYVDDVFSTYLYTGNGSAQTITNGIDLAGRGGLVWLKNRGTVVTHCLQDTVLGATKQLYTTSTGIPQTRTTGVTSFDSNGFTLGTGSETTNLTNTSGQIYASWTFRKAPKFFTQMMVSHTSGIPTNVDLSILGEVGMVVVKGTNLASRWMVWHRSLTAGYNLALNETLPAGDFVGTGVSVSGTTATLENTFATDTYVIYAWAHDTDTEGMMQCGSFTTEGFGLYSVALGWEPQFVLVKSLTGTSDWSVMDNMRGYSAPDNSVSWLSANSSTAESTVILNNVTSTGFSGDRLASSTYIYLAIRRPNKPPTVGTEVFQPVIYSVNNLDNRLVDTGITTDMVWARLRSSTTVAGMVVGDRLRGNPYLLTGSNAAEQADSDSFMTPTVGYGTAFSAMKGFGAGNDATSRLNYSTGTNTHVALAFKRAPGFFDVVCYTGTGVAGLNISHGLTSTPEMIITKSRTASSNWGVYHKGLISSSHYVLLDQPSAQNNTLGVWTGTAPTSTQFTIGSYSASNSINTYVAYLFATLPGISKVGSYIGNGGIANSAGTSQTIDCGFTTGARFVMVKVTSSAGAWWIFDSARGIVEGNDPFLQPSSATGETADTDLIDPYITGFIVNQDALGRNLNVTGETYIYLAIA